MPPLTGSSPLNITITQSIAMDSLCNKCSIFYGSPLTLNLCSTCHKEHLATQTVLVQANHFKIPEIPVQRQMDHSRCFSCRKKVGLLGIRCKACDCSYCNTHRIPEDHQCDGVFVGNSKEDNKKHLPSMVPSKIEKI